MKNRIVLKALLLSLVFVFIFVFSSCSAIFSFSGSYSPQNITGINYNNFTNSSSDILITSDAMYYSKHTLDFSFYEMTQNGSEKMFSHGYSGDFFWRMTSFIFPLIMILSNMTLFRIQRAF